MRSVYLLGLLMLSTVLGCLAQETPFVSPIVSHPDALDADFDGLDDALQSELAQYRAAVAAASDAAALLTALRRLGERRTFELVLWSPPEDADRAAVAASDGRIEREFARSSCGLICTVVLDRIDTVARALGGRLAYLQQARTAQVHLSESLRAIRVRPHVWDAAPAGATPVTVAVVDTGYDETHADLPPALARFDALAGSFTPGRDAYAHGTAIAGAIAGSGVALAGDPGDSHWTWSGALPGPGSEALLRPPVLAPGQLSVSLEWDTLSAGAGAWVEIEIRQPGGAVFGRFQEETSPLRFDVEAHDVPVEIALRSGSPVLPAPEYVLGLRAPRAAATDGYAPLRGTAPESRLLDVRCFDAQGKSAPGSLEAGLEWVLAGRNETQVRVVNLSGGYTGRVNLPARDRIETLARNGLIVIASAGNGGAAATIGDPALSPYAITVGAVDDRGALAGYSSPSLPSLAKPDLLAPGGSADGGRAIAVPESNHGDGSFFEQVADDYTSASGTSLAAAHVAGCVVHLIRALEAAGHVWRYTLDDVLRVKQLLCMTACETDLPREGSTTGPPLDRGTPDPEEGYGLIAPDAALDALRPHPVGQTALFDLDRSAAGGRRVWARSVALEAGRRYLFTLACDADLDADLYLYDGAPGPHGEPRLLARSAHPDLGVRETIPDFTAELTGPAYVVVKAVTGGGTAFLGSQVSNPDTPTRTATTTATVPPATPTRTNGDTPAAPTFTFSPTLSTTATPAETSFTTPTATLTREAETPTPPQTEVPAPTETSSNTPSPSNTSGPTDTVTPQEIPTLTPSPSLTDTPSLPLTPSPTATDAEATTPTDTPTAVLTPPDTPPITPRDTLPDTPPHTPFDTPPPTATPTQQETPTETLAVEPSATATPRWPRPDGNGDGRIDGADLLLLVRARTEKTGFRFDDLLTAARYWQDAAPAHP